jgi:bromodomain-containing protein 4
MTQQQQKAFISSLSSSLESTHAITSVTATASLNTMASTVANVAAPNSQLLQQLQQPLDVKPLQASVNNPPSSANKNISIPNPTPTLSSKVDQPEPSPTGNNNKSNINLNHMIQPNSMSGSVPVNLPSNVPQQHQQQSLLSSGHMSSMHVPSVGKSMQMLQNTSTPSIIQQQLTNPNPNQLKHQPSFGMNSFVDPLEQSLASLEQPQMNNNSQKNSSQDMALLMDFHKQKQMILQQMAAPHNPSPNGFGSDFNGGNGVNNHLMNMLMPQIDMSNLPFPNQQMMNASGRFPEPPWNNLPNNNPMLHSLAAQQQMAQQQTSQQSAAAHPSQSQSQQQHQSGTKQEKIMLTPKPIEELLMNPNEKTKTLGAQGPAFGQVFNKYEQNLKNASSWSQLAAAGSPQNPVATIQSKSKVPSDTFQEYRTKLKEQQQRQKQEQEKMKKQKEQELKRQQESLQKQKPSTNDDVSNGHRYSVHFYFFKLITEFFNLKAGNHQLTRLLISWRKCELLLQARLQCHHKLNRNKNGQQPLEEPRKELLNKNAEDEKP